MGDVFDQAATPAQSGTSGDIFDQAAVAGSPTLAAYSGPRPDFSQNPPGVPRPNVNMQYSTIGALYNPSSVPEAGQQVVNAPMPGSSEGAGLREALGSYVQDTGSDFGGGVKNIAQGNVARGTHQIISGVGNVTLPAAALVGPAAAAANPVSTALSVGGAVAGQKAAKAGAKALGATPDQQDLAGDIGGAAGGSLAVGARGLVKAVTKAVQVPAAISADTTSTLATIAHNEGLPPITSETARDAAQELQDSFLNRAKGQYQVVDKAVDGDIKPVQDRIQSLKKAIRAQANVNPDLADKYIDELATQQKTLQGLIDKAKANGVPNADQLMAAGDRDYARAMAMKKVTSGFKTASGEVKMGGHPNPQSFAAQVDRLNNVGTLQRALGEDGANALKDVAKQGLDKAKTAATVKKVATRSALAVGGGLAYEGAKHALSGK